MFNHIYICYTFYMSLDLMESVQSAGKLGETIREIKSILKRNPSPMQKKNWGATDIYLVTDKTGRQVRLPAVGLLAATATTGALIMSGGTNSTSTYADTNVPNQISVEHIDKINSMPSQNAGLVDLRDKMVAKAEVSGQEIGTNGVVVESIHTTEETKETPDELFNEIFPNISASDKTILQDHINATDVQLNRDGVYGDINATIKNYGKYIDLAASNHKIPKKVLYSVFAIEASGDLSRVSETDAQGPGIMEAAAREMGLDPKDRTNREKTFETMAAYLDKYKKIFGNNLGFALATYYMGPGNVSEMIRVYAVNNGLADPGPIGDTIPKSYFDLTLGKSVSDFLKDPHVKMQVLDRLDPVTSEYVARIAAGLKAVDRSMQN